MIYNPKRKHARNKMPPFAEFENRWNIQADGGPKLGLI